MENISKITLPNDTTYDIKDKNARNFTNIPYYKQDEEALMFQLGESYMTEEQDNQPYLFRAAGGSADIGNREYDKIIGGTVAWNQLLANANFSNSPFPSEATIQYDSTTDSVSYSATITTPGYGYVSKSYFNIKKDHIYLLQFNVEATNVTYVWGKVDNAGNTPAGHAYANRTHAFIQKSSRSNTSYVVLGISANSGTSVTATFSKPQIFDLTQMFGTTIADYIYSLEQATLGAGVAWFRKLFPADYYAYNAGELISVQTSVHRMVGFNAYNPTAGKAKIIGGMVYQVTGAFTALSLDGVTIEPDEDGYFTPEKSGELTVTGGNATTTCVHLVWDGERDGEWEEYKERMYPLDSDLVLRGIPMLDENNKLYYDGDTYKSDGTVKRKYGIVDLGTLNWYKTTVMDTNVFQTQYIYNARREQNVISIICSLYKSAPNKNGATSALNNGDETVCFVMGTAPYVQINDSSKKNMTAAEFKADMSGVMLVYKLATPTTETAEPYDNPQIVTPGGTEEYITTSIVPVGHETRY